MAPFEATVTTGPTSSPASGVPEVDAVLTDLEILDQLPVEEHVAVFAKAHEALSQALDGARGAAERQAPAAPQHAEG